MFVQRIDGVYCWVSQLVQMSFLSLASVLRSFVWRIGEAILLLTRYAGFDHLKQKVK